MDLRRFCNGGGDADSPHFNLMALPNYYDLPAIGGSYAVIMFPKYQDRVQRRFEEKIRFGHILLRRQMNIPDDAFEFSPQHNVHEENAFIPLVFKEEYSRNNRAKHIIFQRRLDILVKKYYNEGHAELLQLIRFRKKIGFCVVATILFGVALWYGFSWGISGYLT